MAGSEICRIACCKSGRISQQLSSERSAALWRLPAKRCYFYDGGSTGRPNDGDDRSTLSSSKHLRESSRSGSSSINDHHHNTYDRHLSYLPAYNGNLPPHFPQHHHGMTYPTPPAIQAILTCCLIILIEDDAADHNDCHFGGGRIGGGRRTKNILSSSSLPDLNAEYMLLNRTKRTYRGIIQFLPRHFFCCPCCNRPYCNKCSINKE